MVERHLLNERRPILLEIPPLKDLETVHTHTHTSIKGAITKSNSLSTKTYIYIYGGYGGGGLVDGGDVV